ncbi:helix-turn-helix domain-containing protein [Salinimicrobium terrae]|uniref:helix-turn-helix domain-containing protein n=1 Tax=Salinimicrobium terrae TaxID=470866 RepID=UPI0003F63D3B|nr:helix-turn-helix domain-containing protein [Salinimicrobium terrae]
MSKIITQVHGISPEELREDLRREIKQDLREELQAFSKLFAPKEPTEWITRQEAAALIGVSLVSIHNWTKVGVIQAHKIGTRIRFKRSEIENILLNSNKRASK